MRLHYWLLAVVVTLVAIPVAPAQSASLSPELQKALDSSKYGRDMGSGLELSVQNGGNGVRSLLCHFRLVSAAQGQAVAPQLPRRERVSGLAITYSSTTFRTWLAPYG